MRRGNYMMHLILEKIKERLFSDNLVRENEHLKAENSVLRKKLAMYRHEIGVDNDTFVFYDCHACRQKAGALPLTMITCPFCLDKRCPKADNHENECKEKAVINDERA